MATNDSEQYVEMVMGIEEIITIIARYHEMERLCWSRPETVLKQGCLRQYAKRIGMSTRTCEKRCIAARDIVLVLAMLFPAHCLLLKAAKPLPHSAQRFLSSLPHPCPISASPCSAMPPLPASVSAQCKTMC